MINSKGKDSSSKMTKILMIRKINRTDKKMMICNKMMKMDKFKTKEMNNSINKGTIRKDNKDNKTCKIKNNS